jgi:diadenosine hexaphosphate hydrolase (ATP-forming)
VPPEVVGAGGVVFRRDGAVLLLQHREGTWVFPKGHLDPGESPLEAALREVEEEAGVVAYAPDARIQETSRYTNARGVPRQITWYLLFTEAQAPVLREHLFPHGGFYPPAEARTRLSFEQDRQILEQMLVHVATPEDPT